MIHLSLIQKIIIWALPILFAITIHEVAHGWVASKLGDKTALILGRLTLNPLKHIDLIGTILVPLLLLFIGNFIFGWAKPVPINPQNLKHPRRDMALISLAGPLSNFIMAILWALIMKLGLILMHAGSQWTLPIALMGQAGIFINLILMILNLIPIPPLDGSHIIAAFLPAKLAFQYERLGYYGFFILLILLVTNILAYIISPLMQLLSALFSFIFQLPL